MADIYIHYGEDPAAMTYALMREASISAGLERGMHVVVKPNLVVSRPAEGGATTHPAVVEGILQYLLDAGISRITIAEGSWVGDSTEKAWKHCGYDALARRYGASLLDTKRDDTLTCSANGLKLHICRTPAEADFLINVPVLKGHCQTDLTCCLKNLKGCIPDGEKRRYHTMGLHKPIAALNSVLRPHLHIVDSICGDLTFEEGGNPVQSDRVLLSRDGLLLDSYCAGLLGYRPEEIGYLQFAREYGLGSFCSEETSVQTVGDGAPPLQAVRSAIAHKLKRYIDEDGACSACYAALVFALHKSAIRPSEPVKIGQGFRGVRSPGAGVGNCASGCCRSVAGCPPRAVEIVQFLEKLVF